MKISSVLHFATRQVHRRKTYVYPGGLCFERTLIAQGLLEFIWTGGWPGPALAILVHTVI